LIIEELDW